MAMLHRVSEAAGRREHAGNDDGGDGDDLGRAAAVLHDLLASFVRRTPRDMSLTTTLTLSTLDRLGPRRVTELAESEGVTQPSMTALVTSLVRAGYVEKRSDPADRRVVMVAITEAGAAYVRHRRATGTQVFHDAIEKLSAREESALDAAVPVIERIRELLDPS